MSILLEIRNNYDSEMNEAMERVSEKNPVMGVFFDNVENRVVSIIGGKSTIEVVKHFDGIVDTITDNR